MQTVSICMNTALRLWHIQPAAFMTENIESSCVSEIGGATTWRQPTRSVIIRTDRINLGIHAFSKPDVDVATTIRLFKAWRACLCKSVNTGNNDYSVSYLHHYPAVHRLVTIVLRPQAACQVNHSDLRCKCIIS